MLMAKIIFNSIFCSCFLLFVFCSAQDSLRIRRGIELTILEDYDKALKLFQQLEHDYPEHPGPSFYCATVWQSKMMDFETRQWEESFYHSINHAIEKAQSRLEDDLHSRFYFGAAMSYKSFVLGRNGHYLKSMWIAARAIDHLQQVVEVDSTFYAAYLGLGSYKYWRSYLTRHVRWLPFFSDKRKQGIKMLETVARHGYFSRWSAMSNLAWIYIKEEKYDKAIHWANKGLSHFPDSRFFLWPLGDAQFLAEDYTKAQSTYEQLLDSVTSESFNNHYNEIVLHLKLAQCSMNLGRIKAAREHCELVLQIESDVKLRDRLEAKKDKARQLLREIFQRDE